MGVRAGLVVGLAVCAGCAQTHRYQVRAGLPWPDEWVSGSRIPFDRTVLLPTKTVRWHRQADWDRLIAQIEALRQERGDLYVFTRRMVATVPHERRSARNMPYLEVKVGAKFFGPLVRPGKISVVYDNADFREVLGELTERIGRGYLLGPTVKDVAAVTAELRDVDPREALVRILIDRDLFVEPIWFNPVTVRSFEYRSQRRFLQAVREVTAMLSNPDPQVPLSVVPLEQWVRSNAGYQRRFRAELAANRLVRELGPLPGTELLGDDVEMAKKQILYALARQLRQEGDRGR